MLNFLEYFPSYEEIFILIVLLVIAIKELIEFIDWFNERGKKHFKHKETLDNINDEVKKRQEAESKQQEEIDKSFAKIDEKFDKINNSISMLIDSDIESIKTFILDKHNYYCKEQHPIDDFTMDCLEKRFAIYEREGGNSFVHQLMEELREWHSLSNNIQKNQENQEEEERDENCIG